MYICNNKVVTCLLVITQRTYEVGHHRHTRTSPILYGNLTPYSTGDINLKLSTSNYWVKDLVNKDFSEYDYPSTSQSKYYCPLCFNLIYEHYNFCGTKELYEKIFNVNFIKYEKALRQCEDIEIDIDKDGLIYRNKFISKNKDVFNRYKITESTIDTEDPVIITREGFTNFCRKLFSVDLSQKSTKELMDIKNLIGIKSTIY